VPVFTYRPPRGLRGSLAVDAGHPACPYRRRSITAVLALRFFTAPLFEGEQLKPPGRWPLHPGAFSFRRPVVQQCRQPATYLLGSGLVV
jgi:hypothetical protein